MEESRFEKGQTFENINQANEGLSNQSFFDAVDSDLQRWADSVGLTDVVQRIPLSSRTPAEMDYMEAYGVWPEEVPDWVLDWLEDDGDSGDGMSDTWWDS